MTAPRSELWEVARQLRAELEWAKRVGAPIDRTSASPLPHSPDDESPPVSKEKARAEPAFRPSLPVAPESVDDSASVAAALDGCESLEEVQAVLGDCERCPLSTMGRRSIVFGRGHPDADLMFVGEGPGAEEDRRGEPFVGKAGQLLDRIIKGGIGVDPSEVYIANIVKCRPPNNRDPEPGEVERCEPFLAAQIRLVSPKIIVCLGRYASQALLAESTPITRLRGNWRTYRGIPVMPTYHPAYLLRNPAEKRPVWEDIQAVLARLGWPRPQKNP